MNTRHRAVTLIASLRDRAAKLMQPPASAAVTLRIFLIRTGENDFRRPLDIHSRFLTTAGKSQALAAAHTIRDSLAGAPVTVFTCRNTPVCYQEMADIVSRELGVDPTQSDIKYPPGTFELPELLRLLPTTCFVIVTDGSNLGASLREYPGPPVRLGLFGPPQGSVHELVVNCTARPGGWPVGVTFTYV